MSQVERTRNFFAAVFGGTLLKNASASKSYLKAGSAYLAFERPRTAGGPLVTDHVSVAIRNIEMARVHALLDARGIAYRDYPSGRDTAVVDSDGIRIQLSPENGWSLLKPPTFAPDAVVLEEEAVFRPTASNTSCSTSPTRRRRPGSTRRSSAPSRCAATTGSGSGSAARESDCSRRPTGSGPA